VSLAIFDLDETLISTDSDHAWGEYISSKGLVDPDTYRAQNQRFYEDYKRGELDADAYYAFACEVLSRYPLDELLDHRARFVESVIKPHVLRKALDLVEKERAKGKTLLIVTATMEFITRPIADLFQIETLIAPTPETRDGQYTGNLAGIPSFGPGKVTRLKSWLSETGNTLGNSVFYSDSHNDLPLLEVVDKAIAVDPDDKLREIALDRGWSCISLR
jgi:HAD superfamily hydrolase (TIGR01490 family)